MAESWQCPYCSHHAVITDDNSSHEQFVFNHGNKYGLQLFKVNMRTCPNPDCLEYQLWAYVGDCVIDQTTRLYQHKNIREAWQLLPQSEAKVFPDYVPAAIRADYGEACAIKNLSPKASATLSRRCLQGMIRDFWGINNKRNLQQEIEAIQETVDPETWEAIDAVRSIGNIGAHMERDIDLIIDVDPDEAQILIDLIETLISEWYLNRRKRQERMAKIKAVKVDKQEAKQPPPNAEG